MVVISTHGMSGWHPLIFGSIAKEVIKQANCTLLLLQSGQHEVAAEEPAIELRENSLVPPARHTDALGSTVPGPETLVQERLDRVADELAERGGSTEQQYDQGHPLFTK